MRTLLIVDDEVMIADGLRAMLAEAFAGRLRVLRCYSAAQAMEIAGREAVDILLTDINMPDASGLELHKAFTEKQPGCRVIYLTGYSDFDYARKALDQHAFAYVLKGEGDDFVISTVERAMAADAEQTKPAPEENGADWLPRLHEYIRAHLHEDLSLNRLAEYCHFHPVYLSRIYKETTGETLSDFINQARQEQAEHLLRNTRMTVLEISRFMGFATDNYFCRWFRKRVGVSPHAYRAGRTPAP
ncbi:MAG: response regulator [Clostridia bacterium]|nr:response regulator [Clostridia bacterium]